MNNCLVVVLDTEAGLYQDWRGCQNPVRGITCEAKDLDPEDGDFSKIVRNMPMWACNSKDVDVVVDVVSKEWAGHEIKVFNLTSIKVRGLGDIKSKKITEDGVFPE